MITVIVGLSLAASGLLFYLHTSRTLKNTYQDQITQQLNTTITQTSEQIQLIDSLYTLFSSNSLIYTALEHQGFSTEYTVSIEKQMGHLLLINYLWDQKCISSVYIYTESGNTFNYSSADTTNSHIMNQQIYDMVDKQSPALQILSLDSDPDYLYFVRNLYSYNYGQRIATMIISVDSRTWISYLSKDLETGWYIKLQMPEWEVSSADDSLNIPETDDYITVHETSDTTGMTISVAAPKQALSDKLNSSLHIYLIVIVITVLCTLLAAIVMSKVITRPITNMIKHTDRISHGHYEETISQSETFEEFRSLTDALNHMLDEVNAYHSDNLEQQMLLKNAEIQALQSQMNPHFLFNTLNTLAWKAQMSDNPDLYQMVISLGELLKSNVIHKSSSLIPLEDELKYTRFYIYLQKMRFEDKISVSFYIAPELTEINVPCFCIQTLVENSFVHGLETKKGNGTLSISINKKDNFAVISICDDGIGFQEIPDLNTPPESSEPKPIGTVHPHVGLRNLNRRLILLYGEQSTLSICSIPNEKTSVSFKIPY
jgi:sensor histidine kinase YesM